MSEASHPDWREPAWLSQKWRRWESNPRTIPNHDRAHLAHIDRLTDAAWTGHPHFAVALDLSIYLRRYILAEGSRTRIYAICEEDGAAWKFGVAAEPERRLSQVQLGNPRRLLLYAHAPGTVPLERFFHRVLRRHKLVGEWFAASPRTLAVASVLRGAQEQCEAAEGDGYGPTTVDDTIAVLTTYSEIAAMEQAA